MAGLGEGVRKQETLRTGGGRGLEDAPEEGWVDDLKPGLPKPGSSESHSLMVAPEFQTGSWQGLE